MRNSPLFFVALLLSLFFVSGALYGKTAVAGDSLIAGGGQSQKVLHPLEQVKPVYKVAYFEAGTYWEFTEILSALKAAVAASPYGEKIVFPQKYHYSPGWQRPENTYEYTAKFIMNDPDIDMVVALGSVASKALFQQNDGKKPVLCLDVANPALIGLINVETQQPLAPNFFIDYMPDKWNRSITLLDILHHIKKIGTLSSDTDAGRTYSNLKELRDVGRERGFEVVSYEQLDVEESVASCKKGIEALIAENIDAIYVPAVTCFDPDGGDPELLYGILHEHKIKTYAKDGKIPVANGALIGISTLNYQSIGKYFATILLQHVIPGLNRVENVLPFEPKIYLNQSTARKLNITFPLNLLINVDGIYDNALPPIKKWNP